MSSPRSEIDLSVLDTSPIVAGADARTALLNTLDLARLADRLGFTRYWVPEHHGMRGVACSATSVVIDRIASATAHIRVGSGGVLLPNHSPIVLAEQFGTLEIFHPGRIDLGIGRALGGKPQVVERVRSASERSRKSFEDQLDELLSYFLPGDDAPPAVPAAGNGPPIWLLGSTEYSAKLAGAMGLAYAFAGHLNPAGVESAVRTYRQDFRDSARGGRPRVIVSVPVIAAESDERADWLASSIKVKILARHRRRPILLPAPEEANRRRFSRADEALLDEKFSGHIVGSPATVAEKMQQLVDRTGTNELMITTPIYSHAERRKSYEICAQQFAPNGR
ncbi:MAG: LLM class flavin-dependent oxidoreductase [Gemmatimonadales bacterium]|jgi:luciferase family oxidoreductase group 1